MGFNGIQWGLYNGFHSDSMGFNGVSHGAPNVVEEAPGVQSHQPVMIGGNKGLHRQPFDSLQVP